MVYVFVFLGEFGFELLNWQGTIRKFSRTISTDSKIICCSRANLYPLYEMADQFVDISEVPEFKQSVAAMYSGCMFSEAAQENFHQAIRKDLTSWAFENRLKKALKKHIRSALNYTKTAPAHQFIFSDEGRVLNGCKFGALPVPHGFINTLAFDVSSRLRNTVPGMMHRYDKMVQALTGRHSGYQPPDGDIYSALNLANNLYQCLTPDPQARHTVEEKLGFSIDTPFILCQSRKRDYAQPSQDRLPWQTIQELLFLLSRKIKIVMLVFQTGRFFDSYSRLDADSWLVQYQCQGFPEQALLINHARHCLFFTEGDYGSHNYLPPLMGKDVTAVAPQSVYAFESTPIDFWNENVFRFGGEIIPAVAEKALMTDRAVQAFSQKIFARSGLPAKLGTTETSAKRVIS